MNSISVLGQSPHQLFTELTKAGVECSVRSHRMGVIVNDASTVIEITKYAAPSVALVLVAWLTKRPTRKLIITTKDKQIIHAEGSSVEEIETLLEMADKVDALAPNEKNTKR